MMGCLNVRNARNTKTIPQNVHQFEFILPKLNNAHGSIEMDHTFEKIYFAINPKWKVLYSPYSTKYKWYTVEMWSLKKDRLSAIVFFCASMEMMALIKWSMCHTTKSNGKYLVRIFRNASTFLVFSFCFNFCNLLFRIVSNVNF